MRSALLMVNFASFIEISYLSQVFHPLFLCISSGYLSPGPEGTLKIFDGGVPLFGFQ